MHRFFRMKGKMSNMVKNLYNETILAYVKDSKGKHATIKLVIPRDFYDDLCKKFREEKGRDFNCVKDHPHITIKFKD